MLLPQRSDWQWPALQTWLFVVVIYPILEEFAFRGAIQGWLLEYSQFERFTIWRITVANLATSLLFAIAHLYNQPPMWATLVFLPSLVFGFFRERYGTVIVPILLHVWYNLGFVLFVMR